jgi:hypothetical protein
MAGEAGVVDEWVGFVRLDPAAEAGRVRRGRWSTAPEFSHFLDATDGSGSREVFGCDRALASVVVCARAVGSGPAGELPPPDGRGVTLNHSM